MADTETSPTSKTIIVQGHEFTVDLPYTEGHTLSAAEARALNQLRIENLRNNFAPTVKKAIEGGEGAPAVADLPGLFSTKVAEYSFSMPGAGSPRETLDPIEREARALAKGIVAENLKAQGRPMKAPKDTPEDQATIYNDKVQAKIVEVAAREEVLKAARENVKRREKLFASDEMKLDF